jgi:hypothetical protein
VIKDTRAPEIALPLLSLTTPEIIPVFTSSHQRLNVLEVGQKIDIRMLFLC